MNPLEKFINAINQITAFDIRKAKPNKISATSVKYGLRITALLENVGAVNHRLTVVAKRKGIYGGYKTLSSGYEYTHLCEEFINKTVATINRFIKVFDTEGLLPAPIKFSDEEFTHTTKGSITNKSAIMEASVMKLISLEPDGRVSSDISKKSDKVWFLLDCVGYAGATFNIITDGEVLYPTNRITKTTKNIILQQLVGKATVDIKSVNAIDKKLVGLAISTWLEKVK